MSLDRWCDAQLGRDPLILLGGVTQFGGWLNENTSLLHAWKNVPLQHINNSPHPLSSLYFIYPIFIFIFLFFLWKQPFYDSTPPQPVLSDRSLNTDEDNQHSHKSIYKYNITNSSMWNMPHICNISFQCANDFQEQMLSCASNVGIHSSTWIV